MKTETPERFEIQANPEGMPPGTVVFTLTPKHIREFAEECEGADITLLDDPMVLKAIAEDFADRMTMAGEHDGIEHRDLYYQTVQLFRETVEHYFS